MVTNDNNTALAVDNLSACHTLHVPARGLVSHDAQNCALITSSIISDSCVSGAESTSLVQAPCVICACRYIYRHSVIITACLRRTGSGLCIDILWNSYTLIVSRMSADVLNTPTRTVSCNDETVNVCFHTAFSVYNSLCGSRKSISAQAL